MANEILGLLEELRRIEAVERDQDARIVDTLLSVLGDILQRRHDLRAEVARFAPIVGVESRPSPPSTPAAPVPPRNLPPQIPANGTAGAKPRAEMSRGDLDREFESFYDDAYAPHAPRVARGGGNGRIVGVGQ